MPGSLAIAAAVSVALASAPPPARPDAPACPVDAAARDAIVCRVNDQRAARHEPLLRLDAHLTATAKRYAEALGTTRPLTHELRGKGSPAKRIAAGGYGRGRRIVDFAEVLGRSFGGAATPARRVRDWLEDPPIRRALLARRFRDVGVGTVTAHDTTTYVLIVAVTTARR